MATTKKEAPKKNKELKWKKVTTRELGLFCRQLSTTLSAGISMIDALELAGSEIKNKYFGKEIIGVRSLVRRGNSLSAAMGKYPKSFPVFLIQMVRSGEISGTMDKVMDSIGRYYENQAELKSRLVNAVFYPALVMVVALFVIAYLMTGVLPVFAKIFESMEAKIPLSTAIMISLSESFRQLWPIFLLVFMALLLGYKIALRKEAGKLVRDRFILSLPWFHTFILQTNAIRFAESLSVLTESGIDMLTALETVSNIIENRIIKQKIKNVRQLVGSGAGLWESLTQVDVFDKRFCQMVRVGEHSGTLDYVLQKISLYYNEEVERRLKRLTMLLEPMVLLIVGGLVFYVVASVMEPVFEIYTGYSSMV